jgi:two-component system CheB/CheR fusion protein
VREASGTGPRPSVDLLLKSAASAFGERTIAVILTGSGNDGTAGAQAVKAAGGTVVIQNPDTASFPSMPRSLPPSAVDFVSELREIGPTLRRLIERGPVPERGEAREIERLLEGLRRSEGIDFRAYQRPTIARRLARRLAATGQSSVRDYAAFLDEHPSERRLLIDSLLIKVTTFLRDPAVMTALRERVLPESIEAARPTGELRLWSAGCATGEEAYSPPSSRPTS